MKKRCPHPDSRRNSSRRSGSSPVTSTRRITPSMIETMRLPSVLTMSGSSTPATWLLVPEKPSPPVAESLPGVTPAVVVAAAVVTNSSRMPPSATSPSRKGGPPYQKDPPSSPYGPTRSRASALKWARTASHAPKGTSRAEKVRLRVES